MRRCLEYILPTKDSTIGHWRFGGDLADETAYAHDLIATGLNDADYAIGMTENGLTSQFFAATVAKAVLPALSATLFDMGTDNFTIEVIFRTTATSCHLVSKYSYSEGIEAGYLLQVTSGKPRLRLIFDIAKTLTGDTTVNDGRWHYLAASVNRTTSEARMFIDGVEDANSPMSISGYTGNLSNPAIDLVLGYQLNGSLDEVCISNEALTITAITCRAAGRFVEISEYDPTFLPTFLPGIDKENDSLQTFLIPFATTERTLIAAAADIRDLGFWDRCPEAYLTHMASTLGFELIDAPFADETERRQLLKIAVTLYWEKGTLACIDRLITTLGFAYTATEVFAAGGPLVCNQHRMWDRSLVSTSSFFDDFSSGNLALWNCALNISSWWRIESGELVATGNGSDDDTNAKLFDDDAAACLFAADYEPATPLTATSELGLYLRYQDADNWVRVVYTYTSGPSQIISIGKKIAGAETTTAIIVLPIDADWYNSGPHSFWVWDDGADSYTIGMDSITLVAKYSFSCTGIARGKKGLWVNRGRTIAFSRIAVDTHARADMAQLFDPDMTARTLQIELDNPVGEHTDSKREYLHRILPNYVPAGIEIEWI